MLEVCSLQFAVCGLRFGEEGRGQAINTELERTVSKLKRKFEDGKDR